MLTPQSIDGRYQKMCDVSTDCSIWAIDVCLRRYGKVEVKMIPGNHDALTTWHLGEGLRAFYRNQPKVQIDNSPNLKKYWEYGVNMVLLTHGYKMKLEELGSVMASEQPEMWGRCWSREAHTGDLHQRRDFGGEGWVG